MEWNNNWRISALILWSLSILIWALGWVSEYFFMLSGAFAASGGLAIAATTPFFGYSLAKTSQFTLAHKLAWINQRREANYGRGVIDNIPDAKRPDIDARVQYAEAEASKYEAKHGDENKYFVSVLNAQIWIVSASSIIWSTGHWITNYAIHCGSFSC